MEDDDFPVDDNFDDLPLDELDAAAFQDGPRVAAVLPRVAVEHTQRSDGGVPGANAHVPPLGSDPSKSTSQKRDHQGCAIAASGRATASAFSPLPPPMEFIPHDESDLMDQDMDCFFEDEEEEEKVTGPPTAQRGSNAGVSSDSSGGEGASTSALTLTSPPFTYLRLLEEATSRPDFVSAEVRLKAFVMSLLGKLTSSRGSWSIAATISDGTGYLDVELSDGVLAGLLGFSVAEKEAMKRQPARRAELSAGMTRCQEGLVDMCCVMTVLVKGGASGGGKAVVTRAEPVCQETLGELERRVRGGTPSQRRL